MQPSSSSGESDEESSDDESNQNEESNQDEECTQNEGWDQDGAWDQNEGWSQNEVSNQNEGWDQNEGWNQHEACNQNESWYQDEEWEQNEGWDQDQECNNSNEGDNLEQVVVENDNYCESCDRSFYSNSALQNHVKEHEICGIDGCKYVAHSILIEKHIRMQHSTGLFNKIKSAGNTPEEIAKWKEERRKNYPTKENILERQKKQDEIFARGEKLWEKKTRKFPNRDKRGKF